MKLSEIVERLNDKNIILSGNPNHEVNKISSPENSDENSLCVIWDRKILEKLNIKIPIAAPKEFFEDGRDGIICENAKALLPKFLEIFELHSQHLTGIDKNAFVHESAKISDKAYIGAFAFIGEGCEIDSGTVIEPNATLLKNVKVGKNCLIHSGAVIGCDGFGFVRENEKIVKIPQNGGVEIFDDVEIGACTTIDRGAMNDTIIGEGTKIDNHVQVGHNVKIGKYCIICSMSGIAGSSIIEDYVTISVQAGITDHVTVGKNSIIAGRSGVTNDVPEGSVLSGFPARPHNQAKRALVLAADLPDMFKRLLKLEKKFEDLQNK